MILLTEGVAAKGGFGLGIFILAFIAVVAIICIIAIVILLAIKGRKINHLENTCPQCGKPVKNGKNFCTNCGAKIE